MRWPGEPKTLGRLQCCSSAQEEGHLRVKLSVHVILNWRQSEGPEEGYR